MERYYALRVRSRHGLLAPDMVLLFERVPLLPESADQGQHDSHEDD